MQRTHSSAGWFFHLGGLSWSEGATISKCAEYYTLQWQLFDLTANLLIIGTYWPSGSTILPLWDVRTNKNYQWKRKLSPSHHWRYECHTPSAHDRTRSTNKYIAAKMYKNSNKDHNLSPLPHHSPIDTNLPEPRPGPSHGPRERTV
jgi:hypothetical protein